MVNYLDIGYQKPEILVFQNASIGSNEVSLNSDGRVGHGFTTFGNSYR